MIKDIVALLMLLSTASAATAINRCEIPIGAKDRDHYRLQWPLVFDKTGAELLAANTAEGINKILVNDGTEILLSCGPNYLKQFYRTEVLKVKCNGASGNFTIVSRGINKVVDGMELGIDELTCDLRVIEEVLANSMQSCKQPLTSTSFGYVDPLEQVSIVLGEACYDAVAGVTHWAHVKLGPKIDSRYLRKSEKSFLISHEHPDARYKIELFRGLRFDELYTRMRTQLNTHTPQPLKISHFVDEPLLSNDQLQAVKKLGWNYVIVDDELRVLETVKQDIQALSKQTAVEIYVGSNGVRTLHGSKGEKMDLYLQTSSKDDVKKSIDRFPVPDLVWLLVKNEGKAIVLGIYNDADISASEVAQRGLCESVCDRVTWLSQTKLLNSLERRPLICCSYAEITGKVKEMPVIEVINGVFL